MRLEIISKPPVSGDRPTPLLFVHGAWHGAWCWDEYFLSYFAEQGYTVHALSLRGHGGSAGQQRLRWTRLSHYVADVARVAAALPTPPVVIGHSMGAMVVQKYLEQHVAPSGVVLAPPPPRGVLAPTLRLARRHPWALARVILTLSLFPLVATPELTREHFFSASMPETRVNAYARRMQDESFLGFMDMLGLSLPCPARVRSPLLVLGAARDRIFAPHEVVATAQRYHTQAEIFPDMAHDMMLEAAWQDVADRILAWLDERKL